MSRIIPHDHSNIAQGGKLEPSDALIGGLAVTGGGSVVGGSGSGTDTDDQTASEVPITDAGGYFTGTEVETALQELGAAAASTRIWRPTMALDPTSGNYLPVTTGVGDAVMVLF